ncbi:hypothetical protein Raf01_92600 [Rugosimonospora africana]|uniref:Hydrogenase maturation protease n=1 Tax=Rugosimonospora africana TaxID=556532 RepID=A0A8J3VWS0_9ACTN|nr:hypothetical protein Raf01_92600 [Rugosimonospora africana]
MGTRIVVVGVGDRYRRDDGVGPAVVDRLVRAGHHGVRLAVSGGEASELIELWDGARLAIVVGAVRAEPDLPGRIHRHRRRKRLIFAGALNPPGPGLRLRACWRCDKGSGDAGRMPLGALTRTRPPCG